MPKYKVNVSYLTGGHVIVDAPDKYEAQRLAEECDLVDVIDGEYIDGSFQIDDDLDGIAENEIKPVKKKVTRKKGKK